MSDMKPPTPAMIRLLREIEQHPVMMASVNKRTLTALAARRLVEILHSEWFRSAKHWQLKHWHLTDEGWRVLAEHGER